MKIVKWIVLAVTLLVIVVVAVVYFNLNSIVRSTVQTQATDSLNLTTTVGGANLALFGGEVKLTDLKVASPPGYTAPEMFMLGSTAVKVSYGQLRQQPIHINSINLSKPTLVIEQKGGKFNFKTAIDQMPKGDAPAKPRENGKTEQPMKLIIDDLAVESPTVIVKPGDLSSIPGASALTSSLPKELTLNIPSIDLKNIGNADGNQNGAALKDVIMQVVTALADTASKSGALPEQLKGLMNLNLADAKAQLGAQIGKQLGNLTKSLPGNVGEIVKDPNALLKDPGAVLKQGVGNLTGGDTNSATSKPSGLKKSIEDGVGGLLGGKKR